MVPRKRAELPAIHRVLVLYIWHRARPKKTLVFGINDFIKILEVRMLFLCRTPNVGSHLTLLGYLACFELRLGFYRDGCPPLLRSSWTAGAY